MRVGGGIIVLERYRDRDGEIEGKKWRKEFASPVPLHAAPHFPPSPLKIVLA
jgi:hypothetical protein